MVLGGILLWPLLVAFPINGGDAQWVAQSSRSLVACARDGVWSNCPGTYQFGWLQHIPGIFLAWKGLSDDSVVFSLTLINFFAFVWLVIKVCRTFGIGTELCWLLLAAIILGPLYAFSVYSFSELLTGVLLGAFAISIFKNQSFAQTLVLTFVITSSRETAASLTIPIALAIYVVIEPQAKLIAKKMLLITSTSLIGLVSVFFFNYWKYGSISNQIYTDPIRRVPGIELKIKNFLAIWVSPSGGVLPFWFIGGLLVLVVPIVILVHWRKNVRQSIAAMILLSFLVIQTGLLSTWFAPFGWVTWGPRLIIPVVTGTLIVEFLLFGSEIQRLINRLRFRFVAVIAILLTGFLAGISNLGFVLDRSATLAWFTPPLLPSCPQTANIEIDPNYYWSCALNFAPWQLGRTVWDMGLHQVSQNWAIVYGCFTVALFGGVFYCGYERRSATMTEPPAIDGIFESSTSSGLTNLGNSGNGTPTA
jgi:hypothetical protein